MTDPKKLNQILSEGQSAMYARQLEETIRTVKSELVIARQGLAEVARVLCPDQVDLLTGKHPGASATTLPLDELIVTMKGVAQTLRLIASNSIKSPGSKEDILLGRVTELEGLLRSEKRRADLFERSKANAEQTLDAERARAAKAARGRSQPGETERYSEFISAPGRSTDRKKVRPEIPADHAESQTLNGENELEAWEKKFILEETDETSAHLNSIMEFVRKSGKTTIAEIATGTELDPRKAKRMVKLATGRYGLLEEQEIHAGLSESTQTGKSYSLSPKGEWYFTNLSGQAPVKLAKVKKEGWLKTRVGARFEALGWEVEYKPERVFIDEKEFSAPDLVITKDASKFYIAVESREGIRTETTDNWDFKFTNAYRASHGVLCIVTEARSQMTTMLGKINFWLVRKKMYPISIYASTLIHLTDVRPGESPWEKVEQKNS